MDVARPPAIGPKCIANKFRKDVSLAICLMVFLFAAQAVHAQRIDSGGSVNYTDSLGNVWAVDNSFSGGNPFSTSATISGTSDPTLYRTNRWGTFSYSFPVPNGTYLVTLKFAEIYGGTMCTGCRLFNVSIEGTQVLSNFDVYAQPGANTALDKTFTVSVTNGSLDIAFTTVRAAAEVNAVQVVGIP